MFTQKESRKMANLMLLSNFRWLFMLLWKTSWGREGEAADPARSHCAHSHEYFPLKYDCICSHLQKLYTEKPKQKRFSSSKVSTMLKREITLNPLYLLRYMFEKSGFALLKFSWTQFKHRTRRKAISRCQYSICWETARVFTYHYASVSAKPMISDILW